MDRQEMGIFEAYASAKQKVRHSMTTTENRAEEQAKAQYESIKAMMERLEHSREDCNEETCQVDRYNMQEELSMLDMPGYFEQYHDEEDARQAIQEDPLSVEVRSGWYTPGSEDDSNPSEFQILLSTGGPAVRIMGELDGNQEPSRAWLEYQDWGTPWTEYFQEYHKNFERVLLAYAREFYFGG